jgi:hypothetical protein
VSESDRQHGNRDNNRQLATAATSTRPFLAKVVSLPNFSSAADAKLKELIPANLNRSENKPGNQNPKKQTNSARKKEKTTTTEHKTSNNTKLVLAEPYPPTKPQPRLNPNQQIETERSTTPKRTTKPRESNTGADLDGGGRECRRSSHQNQNVTKQIRSGTTNSNIKQEPNLSI